MTPPDSHLVQEMALVLIIQPELNDDLGCIRALLTEGFRAADIFDCFNEARSLARRARLDEAEIWAKLNQYEGEHNE